MDPLKRSPAKKAKPSETADTKTYQVVGELTDKECGDEWCPGLLLEKVTSRGVVWYSCNQNVQGDPNSCPFTANKFRPERDSTKKQTKLVCVVCILPVNGAVSIGKKLDELDDDGKPSECTPKHDFFFVFAFVFPQDFVGRT